MFVQLQLTNAAPMSQNETDRHLQMANLQQKMRDASDGAGRVIPADKAKQRRLEAKLTAIVGLGLLVGVILLLAVA